MNYCVKFGTFEVFADTYQAALACAVALVKSNYHVAIWQGNKIVWEYEYANH